MKKTININWEEVGISTTELHEDQSSETKFQNIHFQAKDKHTALHIWFSRDFLQFTPEGQNIDYEKVIEDETNKLLDDVWENLFDNEEYFVFYGQHGVVTNQKFPPFH
ncbi:MAG: hypothetical protein ACD_80C00226G0003 [uncultured bacterium (gcode 4)]|uniref:Uncharacterized protein n=1 Tax=uncultured bacterium (gcode 4) TaxID=1234023 RepID=K1X360_9BACT|nr:MAG: hypothetical protein ACD_80C00226G0003 [uncultured bacterium (gcode 4)]